MAASTIFRCCINVFNQVSKHKSGIGWILNETISNNHGLKKFSPVSIQQVCYKSQRIRFKDPKAAKEKSYVFQRKKSPLKQFEEKVDPTFLARKPLDNIWIHKYYPKQTNTLEAAISKHKDYADPMMLDNMEGLFYADMLINMKTNKKTKFLSNVKGIFLYPHTFEAGPAPRCLVLSEKTEDVDAALAAGATYAGGKELLAKLKSETISQRMYDYVVCTPGIYAEVIVLRSIFKDKFPTQKKGTVGHNIEEMLNHFLSGVAYESKKNYEDVGSLQIPFGQLNMNYNHLLENFQKLVDKLCQGRSEKLGPFITEIHIIAPPSPEKFKLAAELYVPGYNVEPIVQEDDEDGQSVEMLDEGEDIKKKNSLKRSCHLN